MKTDYIEKLYIEYYDRLMVIACSYTHDISTAEDLVHDAFVKAILSYKPSGSFLAWCSRVLRNEFYDHCRRDKFLSDRSVEDLDIDSGIDMLDDFIHNEERARLAAMIADLPIKQRDVMMASVYLQMDDEEIANELGISRDNVRQLRSRAKRRLIEIGGQR